MTMIKDKEGAHRLAILNPYKSVVKYFEVGDIGYLTGIKNISSIPNSLMHKLEKDGFILHTIDKKSTLAGRAVDTDLYNPISGRYMSGSSSGTAINVFAGINDLGIGNDGGGSVLAPAMAVNIIGFISPLIEKDREIKLKPNTEGKCFPSSIGFMVRDIDILYKAIKCSIGIEKNNDYGIVFSDKKYENVDSKIIDLLDDHTSRSELLPFVQNVLSRCDVLIKEEGPVDIEGFGDSLFGHFDKRTKAIQEKANKGYVRICNIAGATALCLPLEALGMSTLLMCESKPEKIAKLLKLVDYLPIAHDELIERYFLDYSSYFNEGYKV